MKNIPFFDILFIVISAAILILIFYFGGKEIVTNFALIFMLVSYFVGKYVGKLELKKKGKNTVD